MSDAHTGTDPGAGAAGEGAGAAGAAVAGNGAEPPAILSGTPPPPAVGEDGASIWPADWREKFSGGDEKKLAWYKRFASPENVAISGWNANEKMRRGEVQPVLPENASIEEISAFRKQAGIPEKPDGYGIVFPTGSQPSEADKAELAWMTDRAHAGNVTPRDFKTMFDAYTQGREAAAQRWHDAVQATAVEFQGKLRAEYGRDYPKYFGQRGQDGAASGGIVNEFLATHFGEDAGGLMSTRLANGQLLGQDERFVRGALAMALAYAPDETLIAGDGGGGKSLDEQYKEAQDLQMTDRAKFISAEHQALLVSLAEKRLAIQSRPRRRAG